MHGYKWPINSPRTRIGIVACVLGMCHAVFEWELGIAESIAAVIVIGFAVDFTVHLAHMYALFHLSHRGQRPIFTLTANSLSLYKIENSCTARIFSMHNFQTILNAKAYALRGPLSA